MNRREFLFAGAGGLASASAYDDRKVRRVGLIGSGWYGKLDLIRLMQVAPVEVVSLCDPDKRQLAQGVEWMTRRQDSKKTPRAYADYREMLRPKDLDIVLVATPDHWHALAAIEAIRSGADVYCQKPISTDVIEGQAMLAAARKYKRVVQIGTQRRSTPHLIEARDRYLREGKLGKISHVEIYCYYGGRSRNPADAPVPDYLDWEMWTGPAPMRPYNPMRHPGSWRSFMEYGNGTIGDMGVHMLDMVRWMMDLGWPKRISSSGGLLVHKDGKANIPDTQIATFDYGDFNLVWTHRNWGQPQDPKYPWGATFYGDKGMLKAGVFSYDFIPQQGEPVHRDVTYELEEYPEDKVEPRIEKHVAPAIRYHMKDFLAAIDSRGKPVADIEQGYISSSMCILANNALKLGRTLAWDEAKGRVIGDEEANRLLARPYRKPWVHPDPKNV